MGLGFIVAAILAVASAGFAVESAVQSLDWAGERAEVHVQSLRLGPGSPVIDDLNRRFEDRAKALFDEAKKKYETMNLAEIPADMQWNAPQETTVQYEVRHLDARYLSLVMIKMEADYGMAHPFVEWTVETYDLNTGKQLSLAPWDAKGESQGRTSVEKLVADRVAADELHPLDEKIPPFADYAGQFFLDKGEIVLYWTPYQYTPWSDGFIELPTSVRVVE